MYGTSVYETWERTSVDDKDEAEWTAGDLVEIIIMRFRERHPESKRNYWVSISFTIDGIRSETVD